MHVFFGSPDTYSFPATTRLKSQPPILGLIAKWRLIDWPWRMHCFAKWKSSVHFKSSWNKLSRGSYNKYRRFRGRQNARQNHLLPLLSLSFKDTNVRDLMDKSCDLYAGKSNFDQLLIFDICKTFEEKKKLVRQQRTRNLRSARSLKLVLKYDNPWFLRAPRTLAPYIIRTCST